MEKTMNKARRAALKALSTPDLKTKKYYKLQRRAIDIANIHIVRPFYKIWDHSLPAHGYDIPVRIFSPRVKGRYPVLIFFHGGGWVTGSIDSYDRVCTNMAAVTKHVVVSVDYRLAPEHKFPAAPEDCYLVTKEIFMDPELLEVTTDEITLIGDSAGGNLAAVVSLMARDRGDFLPKRQILIYPCTGSDRSNSSPYASLHENGADYILTLKRIQDYMALYKSSDDDLRNPYLAPILTRDLSDQPDTLIITAEFDPLRDEAEAYGIKLRKFGNKVRIARLEGAIHGFMSRTLLSPHVRKTYEIINSFLA